MNVIMKVNIQAMIMTNFPFSVFSCPCWSSLKTNNHEMITSNPKIILTNESYFKFYNSIYINMFVDDKNFSTNTY